MTEGALLPVLAAPSAVSAPIILVMPFQNLWFELQASVYRKVYPIYGIDIQQYTIHSYFVPVTCAKLNDFLLHVSSTSLSGIASATWLQHYDLPQQHTF